MDYLSVLSLADYSCLEGVFDNQAEIDFSPVQSGAHVGGLKYIDLNGDGLVNNYDKVLHDDISVYEGETTTKTIIIGN